MKFVVDNMFPAWCNRAAHIFRTVFSERAAVLGINWAEGVILLKMSMGHNTLADLTRHIEHSHPSILRHIDKLEELGFVERTAHPEDRRVKILVLTERGQSAAESLQVMASSYSLELEERFGHERIKVASELMRDVVAHYAENDFLGCPAARNDTPKAKETHAE
ncbi:MAG: MarR family transcriptional regulator [bacterium]|nr:MarR family transcriptional regulator [bacterium]MBK8129927.1 MarR family transcriptional regulator [bacterium]